MAMNLKYQLPGKVGELRVRVVEGLAKDFAKCDIYTDEDTKIIRAQLGHGSVGAFCPLPTVSPSPAEISSRSFLLISLFS